MVRRRSFCRIEMMLLVLCFLKDIKEVKGSVQLLVSSQSKDATKVLVFGTTGSCKSTLIYGVAGKDLAVRKVIRVDVSGDDQLWVKLHIWGKCDMRKTNPRMLNLVKV